MTSTPDQLIINSPYVVPQKHWLFNREFKTFSKQSGRRPAGYTIASDESKAHDDPGRFVEIPLVNLIRLRVDAWRAKGYPGATGITRRLLEHWYDPEERVSRRFFFCQLEAIETLMWWAEAPEADKQGIVIPGDSGPFERLCCKMATGSGKTIVMAMLIAWQALNKVTYPQDRRFCRHFFVLAPGLTVKSRLSVLEPSAPDNYYNEFNIVPVSERSKLNQAFVIIDNWHQLAWDSEEKIAKRRSVDKRGAKSDQAYLREVLGEMARTNSIIVINDEAHHAWRVDQSKKSGASSDDKKTATVWMEGLDRIHSALRRKSQTAQGIQACFDFSATPFVPGKKASDDTLFDWVVSDFSLNDAIESGLVKTPRVVIRDDAVPDAKTYKSRLYHIYNDPDVKDDLNRKGAEPEEALPQLVSNAYHLLGIDWQLTKELWEQSGKTTPPVMITVCNRTETASRIKYAFDHKRILVSDLCDPERTLHIDSKQLDEAEKQNEAIAITTSSDESDGDEDSGDDDAPVKKLTKAQAAELLRRTVDTVGKEGQPGERIQNVISVAMLSEGWDARTVTHIMGLRAFSSQLLCEQVVGRGLRRTSYDVNETTGFFEPEYVNIFGVPFAFLPHEGGEGAPPPPPKPKLEIKVLPDRGEFEIRWPNVLRVDYVFKPRLTLKLEDLESLKLDVAKLITLAEMAAMLDGQADTERKVDIELRRLAEENRLGTQAMQQAVDIYDQMAPKWKGNKATLIAQLLRITEEFMHSGKLQIVPPFFEQLPMRKRLVCALNMSAIIHHLWQGIVQNDADELEPVFDPDYPIRSTGDMRAWETSRPTELTVKSHINRCVFDSTWEQCEAFHLDRNPLVQAWVKNDHLGFEVLYLLEGAKRKYRPDYLIRLTNGLMLVLEVKGQRSEEARAKRAAMRQWCEAVNQDERFGRWTTDVSEHPRDIEGILKRVFAGEE